jgi:hypothetical protein
MTLQEVPTEKLMDAIDLKWVTDTAMFMFYNRAEQVYASRKEIEVELRRRQDARDDLERRGVN